MEKYKSKYTFLEKSIKIREEILSFASSARNCPNKGVNSNFIRMTDTEIKYLYPEDFSEIYATILGQCFIEKTKNEGIQRRSNEELKVKDLKQNISNCLTELRSMLKLSKDRNGFESLLNIIIEHDSDLAESAIYFQLQDLILNFIKRFQNSFSETFEEKEMTISLGIGRSLLRSYLHVKKINKFSLITEHNIDLEDIEYYCKSWICLYERIEEDIITGKKKNNKFREFVASLFKIDDKMLAEIFGYFFLIYGLKKIRKQDPRFSSIINYLKEKTQENLLVKSHILILYLEEKLNEYYVRLGSLVVTQLIANGTFKQELKYEENKSIYYIQLDSTLVIAMGTSSTSFKPYLIEENAIQLHNQEIKTVIDNTTVSIHLNDILREVRPNITGIGDLDREGFIGKNPNVLNTKFTIDHMFLKDYLEFIEEFRGKSFKSLFFATQKDQQDKLRLYLSFFDIQFESLFILMEKEAFINTLLDFTIDLDTDFIPNLNEKLGSISDINLKNQLKNYYNKIQAYKFNLKIALSDYIIYSLFGFFINPSFLDFRGRRYYVGYSFNIQNYSFVKAFVKLFENVEFLDKLLEKNWDEIKTAIVNSLTYGQDLTEEAKHLLSSYKNYKLVVKKESENFLYNFLSQTKVSKEAFLEVLNTNCNFYSLYLWALPLIKKKTQLLTFVSYVLLEKQKPKFISNIYSFDAVTSGYQMVGTLFKSPELGHLCNLVGNAIMDIYKKVNDRLQISLDLLDKNLDEFAIQVLQKYLKDCIEARTESELSLQRIKELTSIESLTHFLFCSNFNYDGFRVIALVKNVYNDPVLYQQILLYGKVIDENYWILRSPQTLEKYDKFFNNDSMFIKSLFILKETFSFTRLLSLNPWIIEHNVLKMRDLFKKSVMIEIYGGTAYGRKEAIKEFLIDLSMTLGISNVNVIDLVNISYYLESFFRFFKERFLSEVASLTKVGQILSEKKRPISVHNGHFNFFLMPTLQEKKQRIIVRAVNGRKPYTYIMRKSEITSVKSLMDLALKIDKRKQRTLFPPNFIHSMDAFVVHDATAKTFKVVIDGVEIILLTTVHDNFGSTKTAFLFIPLYIRDSYKTLYHYGYINSLAENFQDDPQGFLDIQNLIYRHKNKDILPDTFDNPHFLKYG